MKRLMKKVREFVKNEEGQGLVEYALIIALVGILVIVALTFLKDKIGNTYNNAGKYLGAGS